MRKAILFLLLFAVLLTAVSCSKQTQSGNTQASIVGKWSLTAQRANEGWVPPDSPVTYEFKSDGTFVRTDATGTTQGTYTVSNGEIQLNSNGDSVTFNFNINGNELQLNNADTGFKFTKVE